MNYKVKIYNNNGINSGYISYSILIPSNVMEDLCLHDHDVIVFNKEADGLLISKSCLKFYSVGRPDIDNNSRVISLISNGFYRLIIPKRYAEDLNIKIGDIVHITDCSKSGNFRIRKYVDNVAIDNDCKINIKPVKENTKNISLLTAAEAHSLVCESKRRVETTFIEYINKIALDIEDKASKCIDRTCFNIKDISDNSVIDLLIKTLENNGYAVKFTSNNYISIYW